MKTIQALVIRTAMVGGGTSYDVYWPTKYKPSRPLHGYTYATVICRDGKEYYSTDTAIDPKSRWSMECGWDKYEAHKKLEAKAKRLEARIAKRVFPELRGLRHLPTLWASWNLPSKEVSVPVKLTLPE